LGVSSGEGEGGEQGREEQVGAMRIGIAVAERAVRMGRWDHILAKTNFTPVGRRWRRSSFSWRHDLRVMRFKGHSFV
jgi:hypothetical protein